MDSLDNYKKIIGMFDDYDNPDKEEINDAFMLSYCNTLKDTDKLSLIKDAVLYYKLKKDMDKDKEDIVTTIKVRSDTISKEINNIEDANRLEMIKLKTWFIKILIITVLGVFSSVVVLSVLLGYNVLGNNSVLSSLQDMFNLIFGK